jgi:hypothetical protein
MKGVLGEITGAFWRDVLYNGMEKSVKEKTA